jgi:acyl-homoserine-lactone acylase
LERRQEDTYAAAIEFSKVLTGYGNASQPDSKYNNDQLSLLSENKMRPVWFTREEADRHLVKKTVFK